MKNIFLTLPLCAAAVLIFLFSIMFSACYTLKQGAVMIGYISSAAPLESLGAQDIDFVREVEDIRRFATEELGLKPTKNYTKYVSLDRDYLAAIVSACAEDSFKNYEWHFPVIGSVPYKGFFEIEDAKKEAAKLKKKNLDTLIRPVDAFSTLGWFKDPLYSFMKSYSAARLSSLIIHESIHATVFIKNSVQFNEELAEFAGTEGSRLYIKNKFTENSDEYKALFVSEENSGKYVAFIKTLISALDEMYKSGVTHEEKIRRKSEIISSYQQKFKDDYDLMFTSDSYKFFSDMKVNNAYLALYRLYYDGEHRLKELYLRSAGGNGSTEALKTFIEAAKKIENIPVPKSGAKNKALYHFERLEEALLKGKS